MKNRIKIDGEWYIREDVATPVEQIDPIFFVGVSVGRFTFNVLLNEDGSGEPWEGTQSVEIVNSEVIDSEVFLRNFRDDKYDVMEMEEFTPDELNELRQLLIVATDKGWL
jgi:hypothetical protein